MDELGPLAPHVADAAATAGVDESAVRETMTAMQADVRAYPGVADIVFEYRRAFEYDPLVRRDGRTYFLLVPPHVWREFAATLDASAAVLAAARAAHDRAFTAGTELGPEERGDWEPLVFVASS
ncbi:hypothetical protein [Halobaculum magnesiiphilum]|uniref:DUF8048 domain-containing protein n=1 Tax=Halobaculum magnesiiphilum TaxID=1017351 RepID=A0A8T8WFZ0_9EURY|nr:hypothetical protein [Halobaculum magnesiiphilum]QZP38663.1 hypothetical protein K6T50_05860 [Halobaculum magnesiiphilum]